MPIAKINATEMKDASVQRISLVERGANRSPIKILKSEKAMFQDLDLARVFTKKSEIKPQMVAVVTMKSEKLEEVTDLIKGAGVKVDKAEEGKDADGKEDGSVVFAQTDSPEEDLKGATIVRLNENAAIVMKGFRPYSMSMQIGDEGSFEEVCKAQGFYPGVGTMVDVLRSSVLTLAEKSDNPAEAAVAIQKMFQEASDYAVSMVKGLPQQAFKLENLSYPVYADAIYKGEGGEGGEDGAGEEGAGEGGEQKPKEGEGAPAEGAEIKKGEGEQAPAKKEGEGNEGAPAAPVLKAEDITALVAKALGEGLAPVTQALAEVKTSVATVTESVKGIEGRVAKAEEAVAGTVVLGSEGGDDEGEKVQARKSEGGREIDTGFLPRSVSRRAR